MKNYDPNITWSEQTVAITYQQWDYTATVEVAISGNCKGASVLDCALSTHAEKLDDYAELTLQRPAEDGMGGFDRLTTSNDDLTVERWLQGMCVGLSIVGQIPEQQKRETP